MFIKRLVFLALLLISAPLVADDGDTPQAFHGGMKAISAAHPRFTTGAFYTEMLPAGGFAWRRLYTFRLYDASVLGVLAGQQYLAQVRAAVIYGRIEIEVPGQFWISLQPSSPEVAEIFEDAGDSDDTRPRWLTWTGADAESITLLVESCPDAPTACPAP